MVIEVDLECSDVEFSSSSRSSSSIRCADPAAWRTRLCPLRKKCRDEVCNHAHSLEELRAPDERRVLHPEIWRAGINRYYDQAMSLELLDVFNDYYHDTYQHECPLWAHALYYTMFKMHLLADIHFPGTMISRRIGTCFYEGELAVNSPLSRSPQFGYY